MNKSWFHSSLTREQAEFLLKGCADGTYLMRESTHYPGDFTLCLKSEAKVENYHIKRKEYRYTIDDENHFRNLIELVEFYTQYDDLACRLREPIENTKCKEDMLDDGVLNSLWIEEAEVTIGKEIGVGEFGGYNFFY